jgi:hypothetical protein
LCWVAGSALAQSSEATPPPVPLSAHSRREQQTTGNAGNGCCPDLHPNLKHLEDLQPVHQNLALKIVENCAAAFRKFGHAEDFRGTCLHLIL